MVNIYPVYAKLWALSRCWGWWWPPESLMEGKRGTYPNINDPCGMCHQEENWGPWEHLTGPWLSVGISGEGCPRVRDFPGTVDPHAWFSKVLAWDSCAFPYRKKKLKGWCQTSVPPKAMTFCRREEGGGNHFTFWTGMLPLRFFSISNLRLQPQKPKPILAVINFAKM